MLAETPTALLVAGSTDWGVELNIRHSRTAVTIGIDRLVRAAVSWSIGEDSIDIGAALTLTEIERGLAGRIPLLAQMLPQFASRLIRNGATLGGNLGTGSPIGDSPPALLALDASLVLASTDGEREVQLADYFTGYRQSVRRPGELIKVIRIPAPVAPISAFHKIAKRRFDDISSVAVGFALRLEDGRGSDGPVVGDIKIGLGGVAATPLRARDTEAALIGRAMDPRGGRPQRPTSWPAKAPRSAITGPARPTGRRCCGESLRKFHAQNAAPPNTAPQLQEAGQR